MFSLEIVIFLTHLDNLILFKLFRKMFEFLYIVVDIGWLMLNMFGVDIKFISGKQGGGRDEGLKLLGFILPEFADLVFVGLEGGGEE